MRRYARATHAGYGLCTLVVGLMVLSSDEIPAVEFPAVESRMHGLIDQVQRTGGFTVDPRDGTDPTGGYVVATGRATARVEPAADFFGGSGEKALKTYLRDKATALRADPALLVGAWYDRTGQRVVVSLVELVADRATATKLGVFYRQQSIYNLATGSEVPTGYTGGKCATGHRDPDR